jgi:RHS repeat-associated protein
LAEKIYLTSYLSLANVHNFISGQLTSLHLFANYEGGFVPITYCPKRNITAAFFLIFFNLGLLSYPATSQIATGAYPYATLDNKGFDTINVGNLNVHLSIPIFQKVGRGIPFSYSLDYDNSVWIAGSAWQPAPNFGWTAQTVVTTGYVDYDTITYSCDDPGPPYHTYMVYYNYVYHDTWGVSHPFDGQIEYDPHNCDTTINSFTSGANDGSGYTLTATRTGTYPLTITTPTGVTMHVPHGASFGSTTIDSNGNEISLSTSGVYTDTLGTTVMTVSGTPATNMTFSYPSPLGGTASYTVKYTSYTVRTNFGCSGVTEYPPTSTLLISEIDLPDSSKYLFSYEATPGYSGDVTGRLASVTLPTGGQIAYTYTGGSNGIVCADGSNAGLTRALSNDPAGSTWTYARTPSTSSSETDVTDGLSNSSVYDFVLPTSIGAQPLAAQYYETARNVYQGSGGTPLLSRQTCYNGSSPSCTYASISWPVTQIDTYDTLDGSQTNGTTTKYNSYGQLTEKDGYDFGSSSRGSLLSQETWTYGSNGLVSDDKVYDGSSDLISHVGYQYDQTTPSTTSGLPQHVSVSGTRGNLTETDVYTPGGSLYASSTYTTDDAGQRTSMVDPKGNTTTYQYDSATDTFLTQMTTPVVVGGSHLSTSAAYDQNSGVLTSLSDMNGNTTSYAYDNMLRPTSITYPDGGYATTSYSIYSSPSTWATVTQGVLHQTGGSTISSVTTLDAYGRKQKVTMADGSATDTVLSGYDANGNLYSVTNPYRTTSDSTYGITYTNYDALGRVSSVQDSDGTSTIGFAYAANVTTRTDEAGNKRKLVADGIGRILQVQEPDGSGAFNYITQYLYNQSYSSTYGTYQTVVQQKGGSSSSGDWRQRTFTYDFLGRVVTQTTPEAGTTNYAFTNSGFCASDLTLPCTTTDALSVTSTYSYDALNRITGKSYSDSTASVTYSYDQSSYNGLTISNGKGNRTGMSDGSGATAWSFDSVGRPLASRKTINSQTKQSNYTYNQDGTLNTLQDFGGTTFTYSYDSVGRQSGVTDGSSNSYAASAAYDAASQLTGLTHQLTSSGATYTRTLQYNTRMQPSSISATVGSSTIQSLSYGYGTSGTNNGNILSISNGMASGRNETFIYDNLNRLQEAYDSHWGETYTYDPWGNMYQRTPLSGHAGDTFSVTADGSNHLSNLTYDGDGRVTIDQLSNTYTYDAEGRILTANTGTYVYDGEGNRVKKTVGSTTTLYWPGAVGGVVDESNSAATSFGKQVYVAGLRVWSEDTTGAGKFLLQDHLGSTRITGDASGSLYDDIDYLPFGDIYNNYGSTASDIHYQFTGDESDTESSTDYAVYRNLSGSMARFNRPDPYDGSYDPANPQSLNRYAYVLNNSLTAVDPTGLTYWVCNDSIGTCYGYGDNAYQDLMADGPGSGDSIDSSGNVYGGGQYTGWGVFYTPDPTNRPVGSGGGGKGGGGGGHNAPPARNLCAALTSKASSAIQGTANLTIGADKFVNGLVDSLGSLALLGETGGLSGAALPGSAYLMVTGYGQAQSGAGQLAYAVTGNKEAAQPIIQQGNIIAGPVFGGIGYALSGGNKDTAEKFANIESIMTAGPGAVKLAAGPLVDFAASVVGGLTGLCGPGK